MVVTIMIVDIIFHYFEELQITGMLHGLIWCKCFVFYILIKHWQQMKVVGVVFGVLSCNLDMVDHLCIKVSIIIDDWYNLWCINVI